MTPDPLEEKIQAHYGEMNADRLRRRLFAQNRNRFLLGSGAAAAVAALTLLVMLPKELSAQQIQEETSRSLREVRSISVVIKRKDGRGRPMPNFHQFITPDRVLARFGEGTDWEQWSLTTADATYSWVPATQTMRKQKPFPLPFSSAEISAFDLIKSAFIDDLGPTATKPRMPHSKKAVTTSSGQKVYVLEYSAHIPTIVSHVDRPPTYMGDSPYQWHWKLTVDRDSMLPLELRSWQDQYPDMAPHVYQFSYGQDLAAEFDMFPDTKGAFDVEATRAALSEQAKKAAGEREHIVAVWRCPDGLIYAVWQGKLPKHLVDDQGRTWVHIRPFPSGPLGSALFICETGKFESDATFERLKPAWQSHPEEWPIEPRVFDIGIQLMEAPQIAKRILDFWKKQQAAKMKTPSE